MRRPTRWLAQNGPTRWRYCAGFLFSGLTAGLRRPRPRPGRPRTRPISTGRRRAIGPRSRAPGSIARSPTAQLLGFRDCRTGRRLGRRRRAQSSGLEQLLRLQHLRRASRLRRALRGIFPVFGLEVISLVEDLKDAGIKLNDPDNPGRMYLCGKGITRFAPMAIEAEQLMQRIRDADSARIELMLHRVSALLQDNGVGSDVTTASVRVGAGAPLRGAREHGVPARAPCRPGIPGGLFAEVEATERAGVLRRLLGVECAAPDDPVSVQNQVRSQLMKAGKPAYVEESVLDDDMAYALVLALGGVPCYPILADGASPVCQFEESVDDLVEALIARGIWCAEVIPSRNAAETVDRYTRCCAAPGSSCWAAPSTTR